MTKLRVGFWMALCFAFSLMALLAFGESGFPVIVSSPRPTPAVIAGLSSFVAGIPGGESTAMGLIVLILGGIIDVIARRWPTAKPRDVLRSVGVVLRWCSQGFMSLSQGSEKIAQIGDRLLGQNIVEAPKDPEDKPVTEVK